jgi:molybdate transport system substrate-binding protein
VLGRSNGFQWLVPQTLYPTIRQDAVLLRQGADNEAAPAFLEFIRSDAGRAVIEGFGYRAP